MKIDFIDVFGVLAMIVAAYCAWTFADPRRAEGYFLTGLTAFFVLGFGLAYVVSVVVAFFRWMGFVK